MMDIGLIDVDGHNFPNICLMKLSSFHKSVGDNVEWYSSSKEMYDIVYMSKVFSDVYSKDIPTPANSKKVIRGGTGYAISLLNGKEIYDKKKDLPLENQIEHQFPDYSLYPEYTGYGLPMKKTDRLWLSDARLPQKLRFLSCRPEGRTM